MAVILDIPDSTAGPEGDSGNSGVTVRRRKKPRAAYRLGPWSRSVTPARIDLRTREGKFLSATVKALREHLGREPAAPQAMLIQATAVLWVRVSLMAGRVMGDDALSEAASTQYLAWQNSLRLNLVALGLEPRAAERLPSLREYLAKAPPVGTP